MMCMPCIIRVVAKNQPYAAAPLFAELREGTAWCGSKYAHFLCAALAGCCEDGAGDR